MMIRKPDLLKLLELRLLVIVQLADEQEQLLLGFMT
jgi:hypothetical protein